MGRAIFDSGIPRLADMGLTDALDWLLDAVEFGINADARRAVDALMALDANERYFTLLPLRKIAQGRGPEAVAAAGWLWEQVDN